MKKNEYNPKKIEGKWQKKWLSSKTFASKNKGKKKFVLVEFPYPSGSGLHMGHMRPFVAGDVVSKYFKLKGFDVMYPMGWDAFGLPAENFAIKNKVHPRVSTAKNIANAKKQLISWGTGFDWSREVNTTDPAYYKWTQKIFLELYKAGLAYEKFGEINWCPKDKTGLANEEVVDGKCERCGADVEKKNLRQWYLKITDYAEKLLEGLKNLPEWPHAVKVQQENWIGKSEGAEIKFEIKNQKSKIGDVTVFTTRADTLFGVTYVVLAPEKIDEFKNQNLEFKNSIQNLKEVEDYILSCKAKTEEDRTNDKKEKTGVEIKGLKAVNPANGEEVPVWVADYVLGHYGTGAVMAVPAHDARDFVFAKKYGLSLKDVIVEKIGKYITGPGILDRITARAVIIKDEQILVEELSDGAWILPGGGIEKDEDHMLALKREIAEESSFTNIRINHFITTIKISRLVKKFYDKDNIFINFTNHIYAVNLLSEQQSEHHEGNCKFVDIEAYIKKVGQDPERKQELNFIERVIFGKPFINEGVLKDSNQFNGLTSEEARKKITEFVGGKIVTKYKLRDWVFSRQRYWGEPIPLIHCDKCGIVPVPDKDLPLKLPEVKNYEPTGTGESPLATIDKWVNTKCPKCKGKAKRETNTMPQWAGSSWYWLRYMDPKNKKEISSLKNQKYWSPVDLYFGGMEHTTLHLLYSRFWNLFLYDRKLVTVKEPYNKRVPHGIILGPDGEKMSKSRGNVVNPDDVIALYGADTVRLYMMFLGPHGAQVSWNDKGIVGTRRFLERVWLLSDFVSKKESEKVTISLHKTIKKVTEDLEIFSFNTTVSAMMIFVNTVYEEKTITEKTYKEFLKLLSPFAPHITEELWGNLKNKKSIYSEKWPSYKDSLLKEEKVVIVIQINGKVRSEISIDRDIDDHLLQEIALKDEKVQVLVEGKEIKRIIVVKNRLINIVI